MLWLRYLAPVLLSAFATAAVAQDSNFAKLRGTANYRHAVLADAQKTGAWLNDICAGAKAQIAQTVGVVEPPNVNDEGAPQSGRWIEHISVDGCDAHRQLNVFVAVAHAGSLSMIPMLPGTSHADPTLEKDGALIALTTARVDSNGCKPIFVADTRFVAILAEPPQVAGKTGWTEVWTIGQCKTRTDVEMRFIPDATGTRIVARRVSSP